MRPSGSPWYENGGVKEVLRGSPRDQKGIKKIVKFRDEVAVQAVEGSKIGDGVELKLRFQVADAQNLLVSVKRIVEMGNLVQCGPGIGENYIFNKTIGGKYCC